jgi:hypothetical protein
MFSPFRSKTKSGIRLGSYFDFSLTFSVRSSLQIKRTLVLDKIFLFGFKNIVQYFQDELSETNTYFRSH